MLVKLGDSNRPVPFLSDGENDQDALKKKSGKFIAMRSQKAPPSFKDEEWGGEFVDISPSQTKH